MELESIISKAHSQGPLSRPFVQDLKEGLPGLASFCEAIQTSGRGIPKLTLQPHLP